MKVTIKTYNKSSDYEQLLHVIEAEGEDWKEYLNIKYKNNLEQSITYVAFADDVLCGYVRSLNDSNSYIWIIDLLVDKQFRGYSIGQKLMDRIKLDFPNQDIYVLSDVDEYYEKLGYQKEGSIYQVK